MIHIKEVGADSPYGEPMKHASSLLDPATAGTVALGEATQYSPNGIVSRAILSGPGLRVTLFGFAPGQELTEHTSTSRAIVHVLTGSSAWTVAGEPRIVRAGELLHLPPGTPHGVRAEEPFSMLLTLIREPDGARSSAATPTS